MLNYINSQSHAPPDTDISSIDILPVSERIKEFPKTRYYGSKRKLLPWIYDCIKPLEFDSVLDAFGGTGSVSLLFKSMGKRVTYCDAFNFNKHIATTVLSDHSPLKRNEFVKYIEEVKPICGFISRTYKGMYFTDPENKWLDGFATKLSNSRMTEQKKSFFYYTLFQSCLQKRPFNIFHRSNLHLRMTRPEDCTFGNHTTWNKSFTELMIKAYDNICSSHFLSHNRPRILNSKPISKLKTHYDLVYLDPPYVSLINKVNKDDYWARYHFLEGLCLYKSWPENLDTNSTIKAMRRPKAFDKWNCKEHSKNSLFNALEKHSKSTVVLSYVSDAFPSEKELYDKFKKLFKKVTIHSRSHSHALSPTSRRELILIGKHK